MGRSAELALVLSDVELVHGLGNSVGLLHERLEVRSDVTDNAVQGTLDDNLANHLGDVRLGKLPDLGVASKVEETTVGLDLLLENRQNVGLGDTLHGSSGVRVSALAHGLVHDIKSPLADLTDFRQGGVLVDGLDTRLELGQESAGLHGVVDELGQVLHDNGGLTGHLLGGGGGVERALENRSQQGQHRRSDNGDESGLAECVDGLPLGLGAGVLDGLDDDGNLRGNIVVLEQVGQGVHGLETLLGNLALQVVHTGLDDGDQGLQLLAHCVAEDVLALLDLEGLETDGGLVGHQGDKLESAGGTLPLTGGLAEV